MKPGLRVRIMPTTRRAKSWIGDYGISTDITDEVGDIVVRTIRMRPTTILSHISLWVEVKSLEVL